MRYISSFITAFFIFHAEVNADNTVRKKCLFFTNEVAAIAISQDGTHLACSGEPGKVLLWNFPELNKSTTLHINIGISQEDVCFLQFSLVGNILLAEGFPTSFGAIRIWDLRMKQHRINLISQWPHGNVRHHAALSPDGESIAMLSEKANATICRVFSTRTGKEKQAYNNLGSPTCRFSSLLYSPDGKSIAIAGVDTASKTWVIVNWKTQGKEKRRIVEIPNKKSFSGTVFDIANLMFSHNGKQLVGSHRSETVNIWNFSNMKLQQSLKAGPIIAFSPDDSFLATAPIVGQVVTLWNVTSGKIIARIRVSPKYIRKIVFSPDANWMCICGRRWKVDEESSHFDENEKSGIVEIIKIPGTGKVWDGDGKRGQDRPVQKQCEPKTPMNDTEKGTSLILTG